MLPVTNNSISSFLVSIRSIGNLCYLRPSTQERAETTANQMICMVKSSSKNIEANESINRLCQKIIKDINEITFPRSEHIRSLADSLSNIDINSKDDHFSTQIKIRSSLIACLNKLPLNDSHSSLVIQTNETMILIDEIISEILKIEKQLEDPTLTKGIRKKYVLYQLSNDLSSNIS
tara:strand:+ start:161 stop:691 length:531 start_codon:yes stop_codon:yes gene_type:complete